MYGGEATFWNPPDAAVSLREAAPFNKSSKRTRERARRLTPAFGVS